MYDVAIIGAGPAGATLARLLDSKYLVAVVDKKRSDGAGFHKPCGGLLAPDAQKSLSRFGLTLPKEVLVDPQIFAVRTIDLKSRMIRHYQRFYVNLDRHKFDLWLKSLIPENVDVFDDSNCRRIEQDSDGYKITFNHEGKPRCIRSRYLVGADGANSIVRRFIYPKKRIRKYVAIQQWFTGVDINPFYSCIFDPANTDCYSWIISKDGYFIMGGAYPGSGCRQRFETQKKQLENMGLILGKPDKTETCMVLRPSRFSDFCTGKNNAFLIGEAAGFISPSSLEGISSAIDSALALSQVLNASPTNPCAQYHSKTFRLRLKLYLKALKCPFMYYPPLRKMVMASGLNSINLIK